MENTSFADSAHHSRVIFGGKVGFVGPAVANNNGSKLVIIAASSSKLFLYASATVLNLTCRSAFPVFYYYIF